MKRRLQTGSSYWTQRRRIKRNTDLYMRNVKQWVNEVQVSESTSQISDGRDSQCKSANETMEKDDFSSISTKVSKRYIQPCVSPDSVPISLGKEEIRTCHESNDVIESDCSEHTFTVLPHSTPEESIHSDEFNLNIRSMLSSWAVEYNISHAALRKLLLILQPCCSSLPSDPRTLLEMPRNYDIRKLGGGHYHHFGIAKNILLRFESCKDRLPEIKLQINNDGIPLFKSSKQQFWPILGRILNFRCSTPFVIGLFCGDEKPSNVSEYARICVIL